MEYDIEELQANIEEVKKLLIHAKKLEELVKELDRPLTEEQMEHLEHEFSCMICVNITPLNDVVDRIDSALHHPEMYEIYTKV
jgi:pterin-4a-carbinolamine dehydratase